MNKFKAKQISDKVYWVGAIDWDIRDFHGYGTPRGSTYNAFLILADKITLIDTVKAPFEDELMARIKSIIDPAKIDYIVSNHSEPDHTGSLKNVISRVKPKSVFASKMGKKTLKSLYNLEVDSVENKSALDLGNMTLKFLETRMIHWPDSMFSYLEEEKILFSQDAFGMHLASSERFADQLNRDLLRYESDKYYANIVLPFSNMVKRTLDQVGKMNLEIDMLCPDHGPIWRKNDIPIILEWYSEYVEQKPFNKAVIVYDTMWGSTEKMARSIADGIIEAGSKAIVLRCRSTDRSIVIKELLYSGALIIGSPTINNNIFPSLADVLTYIKGLKPQNLIGAAFGSFGWSGESVGILENYLRDMKIEPAIEGIKLNYIPGEKDLDQCRKFGVEIASKMKEILV